MKINTECAVKHLKHDLKEVGLALAIIMAIAVIVAIPVYLNPSAYMVLNTLAGCIVILATVGVAIFWDKETFALTDEHGTKSYLDVWFPICIAGVGGAILYGAYIVAAGVSSGWESAVPSVVVFALLILIGTPIACAIARCKE